MLDAYRKGDIHVNGIFRATVDRHPIPSRGSRENSRCQGVDYLVNGGALQLHFIVVGIAQMRKAVDVMATLGRLQSHLAARVVERLNQFPCRLFVSLHSVVHMKGWCSMKDKRGSNPSVS